MERAADRQNRGGPWLVAAVVLVASLWSLTDGAPAEIPVAQDVVRDLLLARQCNTEAGCPEAGASTSVPELYQGTLWIRYLALADRLGLGMQAVRGVTLAAAALALALLAWVATFVAGPGAGFGAAGLGLLFFAFSPELPEMQWNPALLPLPSVLLLGGMLLAEGRAATAGCLVAGLAFGIMVQLHPVSLLALPGLVVLLATRRPKRWPLVYAGMALLAALPALFSLEALRTIPTALGQLADGHSGPAPESADGSGVWWAVAAAAVVAGVVWAGVGGRESAIRNRPGWVAVGLGAAPAALLLVLALAAGRQVPDRYVLPFLPGAVLLMVLVAGRLLGRISDVFRFPALRSGRTNKSGTSDAGGEPVGRDERSRGLGTGAMARPLAGIAVLAAAVVVQFPGAPDGSLPLSVYTFEEVEAVAARLRELGIRDVDAAVARLRGPGLFYLHSALSLYLEPETPGAEGLASARRGSLEPRGAAGSDEGGALRVVKVRSGGTWPEAWSCRTGEEGWAVCVVPFAESLRWDEAVVRFETGSGTGMVLDGEGPQWHRISLLRDRTYSEPGYPELQGVHDESEWAVMRWQVPVVVSSDGPMLLIPSSSESAGEARAGGIPLTGIAHSWASGGRMVVIDGGQRGQRGLLEVEWRFARHNRFVGRMLPDVLEVELARPDALELLEHIAPTTREGPPQKIADQRGGV